MRVPTAVLAIAAALGSPAYSQPIGTDDGEAARAARIREGAAAARGPQIGEGNPIPEPRRSYSAEEREAAQSARRGGGVPAAKPPVAGPAPEPPPKLFSPERDAARAPYKNEAIRANKAGEIRSRGEASY
ncbi:MAG: hypothetical protein EOP82_26835 [Variovorax sp.]|nr:MAG: hypothetical protein EOP82_26835 [Variovorax sp.]